MLLNFLSESIIFLVEYFLLVLYSNNLIITSEIKQVRKWASICSLVQTYMGLVSKLDLVILKGSSIFHKPLYISLISLSDNFFHW